MIRRIAAALMALLLMAGFYLYALLQEDEESKRSDRWVVEGEGALAPQDALISANPAALARAMGLPLLLPQALSAGSVRDGSYHGYRVRVLEAAAGGISVRGVRPASAAAMLRPEGLGFESTERTLLNAPLMRAEGGDGVYYYTADDNAAFIIRLPKASAEEDTLSAFRLANP